MWHFDTDFTDFVKNERRLTKVNQTGWFFSCFKMSALKALGVCGILTRTSRTLSKMKQDSQK